MTCPTCGTENEAGRKFCGECGSALAAPCPACAAPNAPGTKFCGECVGFTAASESRDAEETRELLTRYFELAQTTIERYGGTVEKFIGDAVMALWGAPVAQEDDAERAVRAALDLVAAVPQLDAALKARAGVLSGEAAVTLGAQGQGMVAGDLVNTASRIQSAAEPGFVLVGEATKRASEAAVAFDDAGVHELKGRADAVHLWRALRVVAGARGSLRSTGLESPFVGRDRELRLVKELFHASAEEGRAQLALVSGIAGIGKSRLAWEFEKYVDGLAADVFWHRGRCLSYGDGIAYWALAEMVRMRCGIAEDEDVDPAREKLRLALDEYITNADERRWVEPRLAHLLGIEEGMPGDEENLFSAWRILFERLAEQRPTILVFEDLQWADTGLLDFLEYLLEWSRSHPLFVLALARPEFAEKRSAWAGKRSFTQLYLEPLTPAAMDELLTGLVPGLLDDLRRRMEPLLASLLRKEVLSVQADPRSPERGQYSFLQDIVKRVAYETLALRERKAKHLAAARFLLTLGGDEDEFVEVVAAHYIDALEAAPEAPDAEEIRTQAREMLIRAAERAASLAADSEAQRSFERAAELEDDHLARAELYERAGGMARIGARGDDAKRCFELAIALFTDADATHPAARVEARLAEVMWDLGRLEEGVERMNTAFELLAREEPDADLAALAAQLGRFMHFAGHRDVPMQRLEVALEVAENLMLPEILAQALTTKAVVLTSLHGRWNEGLALLRFALETALEHDKPSAALRASYNLADQLAQVDRYGEAANTVRDGLAQARRVGNRYWELAFLGQLYPFLALGEWDEALAMIDLLPVEDWEQVRQAFSGITSVYTAIGSNRGRLEDVAQSLDRFGAMATSADVQERSAYQAGLARLFLAQERPLEALDAAERAFQARGQFGFGAESVKEAFVTACEAALALGDRDKLTELIAVVDALAPGRATHFMRATGLRFRAHLAGDEEAETADRLFRGSLALFQELAMPFSLAVVQVEYAEWLAEQARADEATPLLAEARETFERLEAAAWLERTEAGELGPRAEVPA